MTHYWKNEKDNASKKFGFESSDDRCTIISLYDEFCYTRQKLFFVTPKLVYSHKYALLKSPSLPSPTDAIQSRMSLLMYICLQGVDIDRLNELEVLVKGATSVGRQLPGGVELEVASTGVLSSLDTVGYVKEMGVRDDATIILINSGLDKVLAGGGGFFGMGGASKFLQSFDACYYIKRASTGFLQFDFRDPVWRLWGVPRDVAELQYQVVGSSAKKPPLWEAEQKIKSLCRS